MIWGFAQIAEVVDISQNSYAQLGFLGLLIVLVVAVILTMALVIRYLVKKNDGLTTALNASYEARLTDAQEFAKLEQIPKNEVIQFIRNLMYDRNKSNPNPTEHP